MNAAKIYETWFGLYDVNFELIFSALSRHSYALFLLVAVLIPFLCWYAFYFFWKYPYGKVYHWVGWLGFTISLTFGITWGLAYSQIFSSIDQDLINALGDPNFRAYASTLPVKYSMANAVIVVGLSIVYSAIMKQFSKIQIHLPV